MKILAKKTEFKGLQRIDIRKYFKKGDEYLPTRKGISLSYTEFGDLLESGQSLIDDSKDSLDSIEVDRVHQFGCKIRVLYENGKSTIEIDPTVFHESNVELITSIIHGLEEISTSKEIDIQELVYKTFRFV